MLIAAKEDALNVGEDSRYPLIMNAKRTKTIVLESIRGIAILRLEEVRHGLITVGKLFSIMVSNIKQCGEDKKHLGISFAQRRENVVTVGFNGKELIVASNN